jgi:hypothetical protein
MVYGIVIGLLLAVVSLAPPAWATTWTAADCQQSTVQALHNSSSVVDGDTIVMPACSVTWTGILGITKAITLQGSGSMPAIGAATSGGTTININSSAGCGVCLSESTTGNITLANIHFVVADNTVSIPTFGVILVQGNSVTGLPAKPTIIHHITMEYHTGRETSVRASTLHGVIYGSLFTNDQQPPNGIPGNTGPTIQCKGNSPVADNNWASASTFGTADTNGDKNLYVETSTFTNHGGSMDIDDGCKAVIRYNTFIDAAHGDHGHDTSYVGIRHYEIYNNTYQCVNDWNFIAWYGSRGGTGVITDNIMPNQCYGRTVSRIAATIQALRRKVYALNGVADCYPGPYPWLRQEGWGWAGSVGITNQVLEPIYVWNNKNTSGGTPGEADEFRRFDVNFGPPDGPCTFDNGSQTSAGYIQQGRDYYLGIAKPNYTKFTYPHPLATVTGGAAATGTVSAPPPPTGSAPSAPTGLTVK